MAGRTVSWIETLTKPKVVSENGRLKIYVPREGYVFFFFENGDGRLEKPRKRDRGKHAIDLIHHIQEEPDPQPPPGVFEAAWSQAYAVWKSVKQRGMQGKLF